MTEKQGYFKFQDGKPVGINIYANNMVKKDLLVDLLNEQDKASERITLLEKENEQLKQELKSKELYKKILKESLDW